MQGLGPGTRALSLPLTCPEPKVHPEATGSVVAPPAGLRPTAQESPPLHTPTRTCLVLVPGPSGTGGGSVSRSPGPALPCWVPTTLSSSCPRAVSHPLAEGTRGPVPPAGHTGRGGLRNPSGRPARGGNVNSPLPWPGMGAPLEHGYPICPRQAPAQPAELATGRAPEGCPALQRCPHETEARCGCHSVHAPHRLLAGPRLFESRAPGIQENPVLGGSPVL